MMTLSEFESALYHSLYDFFYDREYQMLADKKQFRREVENGFQNVIFSSSKYENEIWLEVNIGVRFSPIEEIAQQFLDNYIDYRSDSNTLVVSIGKFNNNKYFRYKVQNGEDLALSCEQITAFLSERGFKFLDESCNLAYIDRLFNLKPKKPCMFLYNQAHRCFKGTIAARLNHNKNFLGLLETYKDFLKTSGATAGQLEAFEKLTTYLLHFSSN